jgi:hypothetical protein
MRILPVLLLLVLSLLALSSLGSAERTAVAASLRASDVDTASVASRGVSRKLLVRVPSEVTVTLQTSGDVAAPSGLVSKKQTQ